MDDETHSAIRRTYTSPQEQSSKRHFCGFCGTPLSFWSESPPSEAEYISLTLCSLTGSDLRDLEDLGLLPQEALEDAEDDKEKVENVTSVTDNSLLHGQATGQLPWFEAMVKGSRLGKVKRSWGHRRSDSGRFKIEWEIMEWTDDGTEGGEAVAGKRKIGELGEDETMEH